MWRCFHFLYYILTQGKIACVTSEGVTRFLGLQCNKILVIHVGSLTRISLAAIYRIKH